jgi:hypothetical protein
MHWAWLGCALLLVVIFVGAFVVAVGIPFWKGQGTLVLSNAQGALIVQRQPVSITSNAKTVNLPLVVGSIEQPGSFSGNLTLHILTKTQQTFYHTTFVIMRQGSGAGQQSLTFAILNEDYYPSAAEFQVSFSTQAGEVYLNVSKQTTNDLATTTTTSYTLFTTFQQSLGLQKLALK